MGRKTQITREVILQAALQMLLRDGYASINIKSLAAEIGCSTQPIVWQFENMQKFRQEFFHHCVLYAKEHFTVWEGGLDEMLIQTGVRYIAIARNMPHLFRFVFVDNREDCKSPKVVKEMQLDNTAKIIELLRQEKGFTQQQAVSFLMNLECYLHGIASYSASGFCDYSEEEVVRMIKKAKDAFLACELKI